MKSWPVSHLIDHLSESPSELPPKNVDYLSPQKNIHLRKQAIFEKLNCQFLFLFFHHWWGWDHFNRPDISNNNHYWIDSIVKQQTKLRVPARCVQSRASGRWTSWAGCSLTAGRCPAQCACASWSWRSSACAPVTSAASCACPTAACPRSWPGTTTPGPSCPEPSAAASPGSPPRPWSTASGTTSRATRASSPGRSGTGCCRTGCATSSTSRLWAPSAGYSGIRSGLCQSRMKPNRPRLSSSTDTSIRTPPTPGLQWPTPGPGPAAACRGAGTTSWGSEPSWTRQVGGDTLKTLFKKSWFLLITLFTLQLGLNIETQD